MISQPLCDIIMSFQGHGQADHVPGDETSASIGQYGVTDFIEIYSERILETDYFYRSLEESVTVANPNDDGYFEFDQNCTTWQAMDSLTSKKGDPPSSAGEARKV